MATIIEEIEKTKDELLRPKSKIGELLLRSKIGEALEDFLGVKIPDFVFEIIDNATEIIRYRHEEVKDLTPEKEPALQIDKAVYLGINGLKMTLATCHVTEKMCEGHYPSCPILPLALAAQYAGQAGETLINTIARQLGKIPLALEVIKTRSQSDLSRKKDFLFPGDTILYIAQHKMTKRDIHFVAVDLYNNGARMGYLQRITYALVPMAKIENEYQEHLKQIKQQLTRR